MGRRRVKKRRIPVAKRKTRKMPWLFIVLMFLVGVNCYVFLWRGETSIPAVMEKAAVAGDSKISQTLSERNQSEEPKAGKPESEVDMEPKNPIENPTEKASETPSVTPSREGYSHPKKTVAKTVAKSEIKDEQGVETTWGKTVGVVTEGESLGAILTREGLSASSSDDLLRALANHLDFRKIQAGQRYSMYFDDNGDLMKFEFEVTRVERVVAQRTEDGKYETHVWKATTDVRRHEVGGTIDSSLYQTIKNLDEDTGLVAYFTSIFAYDLDFHVDTHPGDTFRLVVEKEYFEDKFWALKRVVAAEYSGLAGNFSAYWWDGIEENNFQNAGFYTKEGESLEKTFLKTPLKFSRISSRFNTKRMHPVLHVQKGHYGVDYAAPTGTPVWAAANGKIVEKRRTRGGGNIVTIKHGNSLETSYMHLSRFEKGQKIGDKVMAKDVIGYVGSTGLATGPHLHFGVKKHSRHIDPFKLKMKRSRSLDVKEMAHFETGTQELVVAMSRIEVQPMKNPVMVDLGSRATNSEETRMN